MTLNENREYILPMDLKVGLQHCWAFEQGDYEQGDKEYTRLYPPNLIQEQQDRELRRRYEEYKFLRGRIEDNGFDFKRLEDPSYVHNDVVIYFALPLSLDTHLLGKSNFARRLAFLTREEVQERYPGQQIPILSIPSQLAIEMGLVRRCEVTFESEEEESGKLHPDVGSQYSLTLPYSRSLDFSELLQELLGDHINIPHRDNPEKHFRYRMAAIQRLPSGIVTCFD